MQKGESDNDYLSDNFWEGKSTDDEQSTEKMANSLGNQFAYLFTDEESIPSHMSKIAEQKPLNATNPSPNERVIYSTPIMTFIITSEITIAKGILGLAILRYSNNSREDELLLYTASKKIELRQKLHSLFSLKANNQQVIFDDSNHNQWLLLFPDINRMTIFVANVLNSVCRQSRRRSTCELSAGEGEEVTIGHSVLFDVTHFKETEGGHLEEFKKDVSLKMKITKKIAETNQWQQALVGMKRGAVRVVALPEFIGCITLKKLKLAKGKSPETREESSSSAEAILSSDVNMKTTAIVDGTELKEKDAHVGSGLMERMARIGQALPVLSNMAIHHESTSKESATKDVEDIHEESEMITESEVEKLSAEAKPHPSPSPAPRQHFSAHESGTSCGMSLEMFYRTFALELDRLYGRMEMSFTRILRNELDTVKAEVSDLHQKLSDSVDQLNTSIDAIHSAMKELSNDPTKERIDNLASSSSSSSTAVESMLEHLMDRFTGEGNIELSQVRDILRETISAQHSERH